MLQRTSQTKTKLFQKVIAKDLNLQLILSNKIHGFYREDFYLEIKQIHALKIFFH